VGSEELPVSAAAAKLSTGRSTRGKDDENAGAPASAGGRLAIQAEPPGADEFPLRPLPRVSATAQMLIEHAQPQISAARACVRVCRQHGVEQPGSRRKRSILHKRCRHAAIEFARRRGQGTLQEGSEKGKARAIARACFAGFPTDNGIRLFMIGSREFFASRSLAKTAPEFLPVTLHPLPCQF